MQVLSIFFLCLTININYIYLIKIILTPILDLD